MATEKTPALLLSKPQFDYENQKEKVCTKTAVGWIFVAFALCLLFVVAIQFLYSPFGQSIRVYEEDPIEVRVISPKFDLSTPHAVKTMNPWDFEFLIDPTELCATLNPPNSEEYKRNPEVKLLMLVPSAADHFEQRQCIRRTWGSVAERSLGSTRLGFVLGTTTNKSVIDLINKESLDYKDIIQADFEDNYHQLTTKSILMLKWVAKRCPHAQYFLKADDDTFVNIATIASILGNEPYISRDKFIGGHVKSDIPIQEELPQTEFYMALDDYPLDELPPYVSGSAYVMTIPTAIDLFDAAKEVVPILPQEDAFLTGLCAEHTDIPLIHEPTFVVNDPPKPPSWNTYSTLATAHSVTPDILETVWKEMVQSMADSLSYFESAINSTVSRRIKKNL